MGKTAARVSPHWMTATERVRLAASCPVPARLHLLCEPMVTVLGAMSLLAALCGCDNANAERRDESAVPADSSTYDAEPINVRVVDGGVAATWDAVAYDTGGQDVATVAIPVDSGWDGARGLSPHFRTWLEQSGYGAWDFARDDLSGGSFGGRVDGEAPGAKRPVVFVHGNSDRALGGPLLGWRALRDALLARGYRSSELYATSWGPADSSLAYEQHHSTFELARLRAFVLAVKEYSGHAQVSVIAHSMGVTLARKAILGGRAVDPAGERQLGPPLGANVTTFVGIAGANRGLASCYGLSTLLTCNNVSGLFPGALLLGNVTGRSELLQDLLNNQGEEGAYRVSIWSANDEIIGGSNLVWGLPTSPLPGASRDIRRDDLGHLELRDQTADEVFEALDR